MAKIAIVYKNPVADKNRQALRRLSMELRKQAESAAVAHEKTLENLKTALTQLGLVATWFERNKLRQSLDRFALVISLGGDGTFIHTSHFVSETLLLGINSAPEHSVGHYCRYALRTPHDQKRLHVLLEKWGSGKILREKKLLRLCVEYGNRMAPFPVLNDVLFSEQNPAAMSRYLLRYRGHSHFQKSSGLWICTPTGSTAAFASAGGKPYKKEELRFVVRELYSDSAKKALRSGRIRTGETLEITNLVPEAAIWLDGSHHRIAIRAGEELRIRFHPSRLRVVDED